MSLPAWWKDEKARIARLPPSKRPEAIRDAYKRVEVEFDDAGVCVRCGKPRSRGKFCLDHSAKQDWNNERRREKLEKAGLCISCGNEFADPKSKNRCRACLDKASSDRRQGRLEAIRVGLCDKCGQAEPVPGMLQCQSCRDAHNARAKELRDERRDAGLCIACGSPRDGNRSQCARCIERRRPKKGREIVEAMKIVLEYETEWFATGMIVKDEKYLLAKELVEKTAI